MTAIRRKIMYGSALLLLLSAYARPLSGSTVSNTKDKIFAQVLVEDTLSKHSALIGVGLATTQAEDSGCVTIADTDATELGEKCDRGEIAVMRNDSPSIEKESDGYDVTVPLHVGGKTIGIVAMDFKLSEQEAGLLDRAKAIARELEAQIPEKAKLFDLAK